MRTVTIDGVVWRAELTGERAASVTGPDQENVERAAVRFSRHGEERTRVGYVSDDIEFEAIPDMVLKVTFDEGMWQ